MICPHTESECQFDCKDIAGCQLQLAPYEFCDTQKTMSIASNGEVVAAPCVTSFRAHPTTDGWALESFAVSGKQKPTIEDIHRLAGDVSLALSALLTAVRQITGENK